MALTLNMIDLEHDPPKITLPAKITKTKRKRITFISNEAKDLVLEWLTYRIEYSKRASKRCNHYRFDPNDKRLFPFTYSNFSKIWTNAVTKAGLGDRDSQTRARG